MAKKSPFLVWTPQIWSQDPIKPFPYVAFIGELITRKDTPPILNRFFSRGPGGLKNGPQKGWLELASTTLCDPGRNFDNSFGGLRDPLEVSSKKQHV